MFSGELVPQADSRPSRPHRYESSTTRTCNLQLLTRNALLAFPTERPWREDAQTAERRTPCVPRHVIHSHKRKQTTQGQKYTNNRKRRMISSVFGTCPPKGNLLNLRAVRAESSGGRANPTGCLCAWRTDGRAPLLEPLPEVLICGPTELPHAPYSAYGGPW
jgi:hypothetical protein